MLSAAAKYRLTRIALEAQGQRPHLYDRWLARFGGWLIDLGASATRSSGVYDRRLAVGTTFSR